MKRCQWADSHQLHANYHDLEWGVPVHDDRLLFEMLTLESAQAGLSWLTILQKRAGYQRAFAEFDVKKVSRYSEKKIEKLAHDASIVRHRQKISATVENAKRFLEVQSEYGSFDAYLWAFVDGRPITNSWKSGAQVPATTKESDLISKDLKKRGFKFVGSTTCYAYMQGIGMVNDHLTSCFRYLAVKELK